MKPQTNEGFTIVETLVGLATVSVMMLILALCAAPVTKTMHRILREQTQKDNSLLLAKTLKTDLLFMLRAREPSQFQTDQEGFSFLTMHRNEAGSRHSECIRVKYRTDKNGLFRIQDNQPEQLLKNPVRFYYLAESGWTDSWPEKQKNLPRAIKTIWLDAEGNTKELTAALP